MMSDTDQPTLHPLHVGALLRLAVEHHAASCEVDDDVATRRELRQALAGIEYACKLMTEEIRRLNQSIGNIG